jgi:hypothetical protein
MFLNLGHNTSVERSPDNGWGHATGAGTRTAVSSERDVVRKNYPALVRWGKGGAVTSVTCVSASTSTWCFSQHGRIGRQGLLSRVCRLRVCQSVALPRQQTRGYWPVTNVNSALPARADPGKIFSRRLGSPNRVRRTNRHKSHAAWHADNPPSGFTRASHVCFRLLGVRSLGPRRADECAWPRGDDQDCFEPGAQCKSLQHDLAR